MGSPRTTSWLSVAGILVLAGGALAWLLLVFGNDRTGMTPLPDSAGSNVEFFIESAGPLTLAQAQARSMAGWRTWSGKGYVESGPGIGIWLRVTLRNPGAAAEMGVLANSYYFDDRFDGWLGIAGEERRFSAGEAATAAGRPVWGREAAIPVTVPPRGEATVYLRAEDLISSEARLQWWPHQTAFHAMQSRALIAEGLFFGGLLALLAYNTVLWLRLRRPDFGFYALYLASTGLFIFLARSCPAWFGWTLSSPAVETVLAIAMALSAYFLVRFARVFLNLAAIAPTIDQLARWWAWVLLLVAVYDGLRFKIPLFPTMWLSVVAGGLTHVTLFGVAVWMAIAGSRQARFFLLSFGCLFAGSIPMAVIWLLNITVENASMMALMIGSGLEMLLLSLAVADRFAEAQAELVEATEQRRAIEATYAQSLAQDVAARTRELVEANADKDRMLTIIGHDLRSPLSGLTQIAEYLTATPSGEGALRQFAGDAAAMGRQTLLLIEDLVLWAQLRAGLRPPPGAHPVQAIIAPVAALHRAFASERGVALVVTAAADLRVAADLVLAQAMLRNLVSNALKFARTEVRLSARADPGGVRLTVSDDGPGLPPAVAARLGPGPTPQSGTGSGLGLRLCLEISRTLGVSLELNPAAIGTEFSFILPAAPG